MLHQLTTPLTAISVQLDSFARRPGAGDDPGFARLGRSMHRMRSLVQSVLRMERFRPEEIPVSPVELEAPAFVQAVMEDVERDAARKGLRFEARVSPTLRLHQDPDLLTDALGNLVHNAVKLTSAGFVTVDATEQDDEVVFEVRDSGPGIPAERLRTLLEAAQPPSRGGSGIGLQIARRAAEGLGGKIEVESEVGRGSTFRLSVPRVVGAREGGSRVDQLVH